MISLLFNDKFFYLGCVTFTMNVHANGIYNQTSTNDFFLHQGP